MYVKDIEIYENKPVKIVLKNLSNYLMGTFIIKDDSTISFTDRRRKTSLIGVELISLIEPIDRVKYIDEGDFNGR